MRARWRWGDIGAGSYLARQAGPMNDRIVRSGRLATDSKQPLQETQERAVEIAPHFDEENHQRRRREHQGPSPHLDGDALLSPLAIDLTVHEIRLPCLPVWHEVQRRDFSPLQAGVGLAHRWVQAKGFEEAGTGFVARGMLAQPGQAKFKLTGP